jgi:hypothetical protein
MLYIGTITETLFQVIDHCFEDCLVHGGDFPTILDVLARCDEFLVMSMGYKKRQNSRHLVFFIALIFVSAEMY